MPAIEQDSTSEKLRQYFDELRVRLEVVERTKREIDRMLAPDFNIFSILGPGEVQLSTVIAYLLKPHASHGQGTRFLKALLDILELNAKQTGADNSVLNRIRQEVAAGDRVQVAVEQLTDHISASNRRMDIVVSTDKTGLMIENKPWDHDQPEQLSDYADHLSKKYLDDYLIIYLSGNGEDPSAISISSQRRLSLNASGRLITLGYRGGFDSWLRACIECAEADRVRWLLKDLLAYVEENFSPDPEKGTQQ